jgi:hypothetical protein
MLFAVAVLAFAMLHGAAQAEAQTYINTINAPCSVGLYPSCTVQVTDNGASAGSLTFDFYNGTHGNWIDLFFSTTVGYSGVVNDLAYTLTLTQGSAVCNSSVVFGHNLWTLTIPQVNTTDGAGNHVTVSSTQYLTNYYTSRGCHYEVLNGTTTISVD